MVRNFIILIASASPYLTPEQAADGLVHLSYSTFIRQSEVEDILLPLGNTVRSFFTRNQQIGGFNAIKLGDLSMMTSLGPKAIEQPLRTFGPPQMSAERVRGAMSKARQVKKDAIEFTAFCQPDHYRVSWMRHLQDGMFFALHSARFFNSIRLTDTQR